MPLLRRKFSLNQLAIRAFSIFWLAFFAMMTLVVALPYFDLRIYSPLSESEIANYQKQIVEATRNKQIQRIIAGAPTLPSDRFQPSRPILFEPDTKIILGALPEEKSDIIHFSMVSHDGTHPKRKNFNDMQIAGPFNVYLSDNSYSLFFISHVNPQREILNYLFDNPIALLILMLFISTPLIWWFSGSIIKPVIRLQKAANNVAQGDFSPNLDLITRGPHEFRQVGQSFNQMALAINNLISNQQSLLSSISHELKTPLTRLQLATALLRRQYGDGNSVQRIEKEIGRMDKMIGELLLLSRQQMNSQTERAIFAAHILWDDVIKDAKFEAEQRGLIFEAEVDPQLQQMKKRPILLNGNIRLLTSAVENIVTNALKYTRSNIKFSIYLQEEEEEEELLRIRIDDDGSGVNPDEFEKIFKPFYRVDETRTRTTGGTGLGLAIVANVISEHRGKVWAEKSPMGGLAVTIQLPIWIST